MAIDLQYEPVYRSELMPDFLEPLLLSLTLSPNQSRLSTKAIRGQGTI